MRKPTVTYQGVETVSQWKPGEQRDRDADAEHRQGGIREDEHQHGQVGEGGGGRHQDHHNLVSMNPSTNTVPTTIPST